jgi:hypothetical protein
MAPTRRHYLQRIGGVTATGIAGLAGCISSAPGVDGNGPDRTPTPPGGNGNTSGGTRPAGTGGPGVTLASVADDVDLTVEPAVEIVRDAATVESPPRLRTTLSNTSDQAVRVGEARAMHFAYVTDESGGLILLPSDGEYPAEPDCWRLSEGIAVTEEYRTMEIPAGESSALSVDLYATPGEDACLPVGEYRFETTISIVSEDAEPQSSADWGFTIVLE